MSEKLNRREALATALSLSVLPVAAMAADKPEEKPAVPIPENAIVVVVMDPLAAPLSCPCVRATPSAITTNSASTWKETGPQVAVVYSERSPAR